MARWIQVVRRSGGSIIGDGIISGGTLAYEVARLNDAGDQAEIMYDIPDRFGNEIENYLRDKLITALNEHDYPAESEV